MPPSAYENVRRSSNPSPRPAPCVAVQRPRPAVFACGCAVAGACAIPWLDAPLARADLAAYLPDVLVQLINHAETFGNGFGVGLILLTIAVAAPNARVVARLAAASWGAGLAANVVKLGVARARPFHWLENGGGEWTSQFGDWLPLAAGGSAWQSFPSAHTATAVGLACGLSALFPRGRAWFAVLAALCAAQRIVGDMHYLSDTLFAAAIARLTVAPLYGSGSLAKRFDAWERRPGGSRNQASSESSDEVKRAA